MRYLQKILLLLVVLFLLLGCSMKQVYVGASYSYDATRHLNSESDEPSLEAKQIIAKAKTVAFFSPDECRNSKAAGVGSVEISNIMRLACGVLMSELETEASHAGFQVVSWQALRGTDQALSYARQNNIDVLFEINEMSYDIPPQELITIANINFFQKEDLNSEAQPLIVNKSQKVAQRCQDKFWSDPPVANAVTLDLKMVSVKDGLVRWSFRKTLHGKKDVQKDRERTYPILIEDIKKRRIGGVVSAVLGVTSMIIGGVLLSNGMDDYDNSYDYDDDDYYGDDGLGAIITGVSMLTVGSIMTGAGIYGAVSRPRPFQPESVICKDLAIEEQQHGLVATNEDNTASASVQLSTSHMEGAGTEQERERQKLLKEMISSFADKLRNIKISTPVPIEEVVQVSESKTVEPTVGIPPPAPHIDNYGE